MKAIRLHGRGGPDHLVYEDAPQPRPGAEEVLVRVYATGIIANELKWDETYQTKAGSPRALPIPGRDLSGVVEAVGHGVTEPAKGDEVYAMLDYCCDGAEAEFTIALPNELAPKPRTLDHVQAAAVPLTALTAWQGLFEHARLAAGQTILIHGAAGGVGFEEVVQGVDFVFDTVGGDTLHRSWQVVKPGGVLVSVVSPRPSFAEAKGHGVRPVWFVVQPNREQLVRIGALIDEGKLRPIIDTVLPLSQARQAYEQGEKGHTRGKIVLRVVDAVHFP